MDQQHLGGEFFLKKTGATTVNGQTVRGISCKTHTAQHSYRTA